MNISTFNNAKDITPRGTISINDFLSGIKLGKWMKVVEAVRKENDPEKRKLLKEKAPMVTISGCFTKRTHKELIMHSGFISCDFDHFDNKEMLLKDPFIFSLCESISGTGLFALIKINANKHQESFRWLANYFFTTYGITMDPAPANIVSTRFVSYDPDIYINNNSKTAGTITEQKQKPKSLPIHLSDEKVADYVQEAVNRGINIAHSYKEYLELAFALANGFGEQGRYYFHQLASVSDKYKQSDADKQFTICLKGSHKPGITVGTFYHMLKSAGIEIKNENQAPVRAVALGKKAGKKKEVIVEQLVKLNKMKPNEAIDFVDKTYDREDLTVQSISKDPEKLIQNLAEWMKETHPIRKNTITGMIEEEGVEVKKERLSTIYLQARATFNTPNVTFELCNHIIFSEFTPEFNPITEYIENNRHRTSTGNILALVNCIQTDTKNYDVFIKKWLIGMIAAYNGNAVRYVLALVGGQMTGKTEFFRRLLPDGIKRYYAESKLDAGKDDDILMCQKLIVMDDEMGGKSKQDEKRLKELTSKSVFSLRAPYGRHNEDFKRLAILCGTSNDTEIINDPTGNTRIIPIQVNKIDFDAYNAIDKDELFMEILRCFEDNHQWNLNKADFDILTETSENFETVSMERELLLQFFGVPQPDGFGEWLSTTEIKNHIELNSKQIIKGTKKLGIELKKIYGNIKSVKINGISLKKYKVVRLNQNNPTTFSTMQTFDIQENAF